MAERRALPGAPSVLWQRCRGSLVVSVLADGGLQAHLGPFPRRWSRWWVESSQLPVCSTPPEEAKTAEGRGGERRGRAAAPSSPGSDLSRGLSRVKGPISSSTAPPPTCCASLGNLLPASEPVPRSPARGAGLIPPGSVQSPGQTGKREKMGVT